jgi:hypothetical protein
MAPDEARRILGIQLHATVGGGVSRSDDVVMAMNSMHVRWFLTNEQYNRTYQALSAQRLDPEAGSGQTIEERLIPDFVAGLSKARTAVAAPPDKYRKDFSAQNHLPGEMDAEALAGGGRDAIITARKRQKELTELGPKRTAEQNTELLTLDSFLTTDRVNALIRSAEARALQDIKVTQEEWFAEIVNVTFLGKKVTVHRILAEKLAQAEQSLAGEQAPDGGWVRGVIGLRGPGEGLHGLGLAIDLDPSTNPYIFNAKSNEDDAKAGGGNSAVRGIIDRAVLLVTGKTGAEERFEERPKAKEDGSHAQAEASWEKLDEASDAMREYFTLGSPERHEELVQRVEALGSQDPKKRTPEQWAKAIAADRKLLPGLAAGKQWTAPQQGFLSLDRRLVLAMVDAGLTWLGDDTIGGGRDIMHFDTRQAGPIRTLYSAQPGGGWKGTGLVLGGKAH